MFSSRSLEEEENKFNLDQEQDNFPPMTILFLYIIPNAFSTINSSNTSMNCYHFNQVSDIE